MMDTKGIGRRLKQLRCGKGLTQEQLAEILDISVNYLSNLETGRDICSTVLLIAIANQLDASIDYILGDNLNYNKMRSDKGESHAQLLYEIEKLSEEDCKHLLRYLALLREYCRD